MRRASRRIAVTAVIGGTIAALIGLSPAQAAETEVSLAVVADTYTASSAPSTNYGTSASLAAYSSPMITSVLRFTIPVTPAGQALSHAELRIRTTTIASAGSTGAVQVREAADTWTEAATTYPTRPGASGPVLGNLPGGTAPNTAYTIELDHSALSAGSISLALEGTTSDSFWAWSRQAPSNSYRPVLALTFVDDQQADTTAPSAPSGLAAVIGNNSIALTWQPSTDNVAVGGYHVHRSSADGFTPTAATRIADTAQTSYSDPNRPVGTWFYRVVAVDTSDNVSAPSAQASATIEPPTPASQVDLAVIADTYTASSSPSTDYGTSASLAAYSNPVITSLLRFTIPAAPAGQTLSEAVLRLRTTTIGSAGSSGAVRVREAADTWSESGTTYANRPASFGPVLGTLPGGTVSNTAYTIPLDVGTLSTGSQTLALEAATSDSFWAWSRQAPNSSYRPTLELTFTTTGPDPGSPAKILAVGDIACAPGSASTNTACRHDEVGALVASSLGTADRFLALGDIQYQDATYPEFMGTGAYNTTFGGFKASTLPVLGNHEYHVSTNGYFDYFYGPGVPTGGFGTRANGYYATTVGSWTVIGLNSECGTNGVPGGCGVGSPQYTWLQSVLESSASCTVVAMHRPRWSTGASHGSYPELGPLWDLMVSHGVDITLSGHNHVSESFKPIGVSGSSATPNLSETGIRAFTAGGGGASLQGLTATTNPLMSALIARSNTAFGPLELTLGDGDYAWRFRPIGSMTFTGNGTTGAFSGTGSCH